MTPPDPVMTEERLDSLERWRDDVERRFAEAFPGADHVGHCRYHALMIEGIEWKKRLWRAVMEKTVAGLVWGTLAAVAIGMWQYLKSQIKGG